jgi:hypothetical protein
MSKAWPILVAAGAMAVTHPVMAQDWKTIHIARQFAGQDLLRVSVEYGAGELTIGPGPEGMLFRGMLRYDGSVFRPLN